MFNCKTNRVGVVLVKFKVKVMVPPGGKVCVADGVTLINPLGPPGPPEL